MRPSYRSFKVMQQIGLADLESENSDQLRDK